MKKREQRHLLIELLLEEENEREYIAELVSSLNDSLKTGKIKDFRKIDSKLTEFLYYSEFLKRVESSLEKSKKIEGFNRIVETL